MSKCLESWNISLNLFDCLMEQVHLVTKVKLFREVYDIYGSRKRQLAAIFQQLPRIVSLVLCRSGNYTLVHFPLFFINFATHFNSFLYCYMQKFRFQKASKNMDFFGFWQKKTTLLKISPSIFGITYVRLSVKSVKLNKKWQK